MALRVLLGDESSTIKKVFQLALQDFAVEVRPVNIGLDVVSVATSFKPDIVFIDVLLQKKNGYDVSAELKQSAALKNIPVVLMWSGFMELDEDKFQISMANARLEKPFDVGALRKLVSDLVPRTKEQKVSQYLNFPKLPEIEEQAPPAPEVAASEDDFQQVSIPKMKGASDKFRLNLKPEELEPQHVPVAYELPSEKVSVEDEEEFSIRDTRKVAPVKPPAPPTAKEPSTGMRSLAIPEDEPAQASAAAGDIELEELVEDDKSAPIDQLSPQQLENIIRAQSAEVIESVVWKVVPELAAQIIERELNKLLRERDSHP
jgi:DNA-binding response OmpR family regulator